MPPDEQPDDDFPFILTTGRQLEHWHTGAMTRRSAVLDALEPSPTASLHPLTLRRLDLSAGDEITVSTRRGTISLAARADEALQEDVIFIPFAYVEAAANLLTNPQLDPVGKIPTRFCINVAMAGAIVMYDRVRSLGRFAPRPVAEGGAGSPIEKHIHGGPKLR